MKYHHILHTMLHFHQQCVHSGKRKIITVSLSILLLIKIFRHLTLPNYRILLAYSTVMFILSTTHVALAVSELLQGFVFEGDSTPGGPAAFYRINVFPKRKAIYIVNVCPFISFLFFASVCRLFISCYITLKMPITHDFLPLFLYI
jgi:hypothetical protein